MERAVMERAVMERAVMERAVMERAVMERAVTKLNTAAFELRGVSRRVDDGEGKLLLRGIDLTVHRGAIMSIVGPSGAGKSTLLRLLNRLDEPSGGEISVLGKPLAAWPVLELRRRVILVFQEPTMLGLSVRENLALPFRLAGTIPRDLPERMREALERVELEPGSLSRGADGLSVGEKHRVCLARALMAKPEILLLDEPTSGLDPRTAERLLDRLLALNQEGAPTLVIATHRFEEVRRIGGRMAVLLDGMVKAEGPAGELLHHPPSKEVRAFLRKTPPPPQSGAPDTAAGSASANSGAAPPSMEGER